MVIRWQDSKAAFVRNQNFLIRRQKVLNNYHSVSVIFIPPINEALTTNHMTKITMGIGI